MIPSDKVDRNPRLGMRWSLGHQVGEGWTPGPSGWARASFAARQDKRSALRVMSGFLISPWQSYGRHLEIAIPRGGAAGGDMAFDEKVR
jgi:hypothetical protein